MGFHHALRTLTFPGLKKVECFSMSNAWFMGPLLACALVGMIGLMEGRVPNILVNISQIVIGCSLGAQFRREFAVVQDKVAGLRRFGAAALDLAYIAAGRFDAYWERNLSPWDFAAGVLMVREAGGYVTDLSGAERTMEPGDIIAGNETMHREVLGLVKSATP